MLHLHQGLELLEQGLIVCLLVLLGVLHQELRHQSHENSVTLKYSFRGRFYRF